MFGQAFAGPGRAGIEHVLPLLDKFWTSNWRDGRPSRIQIVIGELEELSLSEGFVELVMRIVMTIFRGYLKLKEWQEEMSRVEKRYRRIGERDRVVLEDMSKQ